MGDERCAQMEDLGLCEDSALASTCPFTCQNCTILDPAIDGLCDQEDVFSDESCRILKAKGLCTDFEIHIRCDFTCSGCDNSQQSPSTSTHQPAQRFLRLQSQQAPVRRNLTSS